MNKLNWINTAYPFEQTASEKWKTILLLSAFLSLIIILLQPFGFSLLTDLTPSAGYFAIGIIVLTINYFGIPYFYPKKFEEGNWSILKAFLFLSYSFLIIGFWNHIYVTLVLRNDLLLLNTGSELAISLIKMLLIGAVASGFLILLRYNILARRYLELSQDLNQSLHTQLQMAIPTPQDEQIQFSLDGKTLSFIRDHILYINADGNYLNFHFLADLKTTPQLHRGRIKQLENALTDYPEFYRIHRSYIVNLKQIESTHGNSQGLAISLKGATHKLPVARPNIKDLNQRMTQLHPRVGIS